MSDLRGWRLPDGDNFTEAVPGDYWREQDGRWLCKTPDDQFGNLSGHEIVEHDDGTITVSPSILVTGRDEQGDHSWHGYLKAGVWTW